MAEMDSDKISTYSYEESLSSNEEKRDLDYFYEKYLDANLEEFYQSLPIYMRNKFEKSVDEKFINWANVLQGYRGPSHMCNGGSGDSQVLSPSHGVQEIKFWLGARKTLNLLPIFGTLCFSYRRVRQQMAGALEWKSFYFDSKTGIFLSCMRIKVAGKLYEKGVALFANRKFSEALEYYKNADSYARAYYTNYSNDFQFKNRLRESIDKSERELKAVELNLEGDVLFEKGDYSEAFDKYMEAYGMSQVDAQRKIYEDNRNKTQVEIDAINSSSEADSLYEREKYDEAEIKYQEAYEKSQVTIQRNIFNDKIQTIVLLNKLTTLETLWKEAWNVLNDTECDRAREAQQIFQRILSESKNSLQNFQGNSRLKQYEAFVSLQNEGGEIFNQGVKFYQNGIVLFKDGRDLIEQDKYESAIVKLKEAKQFFSMALLKFKTGIKNDRRFEACVEFVQEQVTELKQFKNGTSGLN